MAAFAIYFGQGGIRVNEKGDEWNDKERLNDNRKERKKVNQFSVISQINIHSNEDIQTFSFIPSDKKIRCIHSYEEVAKKKL